MRDAHLSSSNNQGGKTLSIGEEKPLPFLLSSMMVKLSPLTVKRRPL